MLKLPTLNEIVLGTALVGLIASCNDTQYDANKRRIHQQQEESYTATLYEATHRTRINKVYQVEIITKQGETFFGLDYNKDGIIDWPKDQDWAKTQDMYRLFPQQLFKKNQ